MKKLFLFLIVLVFSASMYAQVSFSWKGANYDHKADLENFIKANPNKVITFEVGKTYLFKSIVNVNKKVTLNGKSLNKTGTVLKYAPSSKKGSMFRLNASGVSFKNMTLDGGNKIKMALIDVNHQANTKIVNLLLRNTNDGIAAYGGKSCPGMFVESCHFKNVANHCIFIVNRNHNKVSLRNVTPFTVQNSKFFAGYTGGVIMDCGNDFFKVNGTKGGKRHAFPTNFGGSRIEGNTFEKCKAWHVGMVQASNVIIHDNDMAGPVSKSAGGNGNSACFHIEQITKQITISKNRMNNNSNNKSSKFIDMAGREGRKRWSNSPLIVYMKGVGGVGNSASDVRGDNCLSTNPNNLNCKKPIHDYGPRNISIFQNTFTVSSGKINNVIHFHDGEKINIGADASGNKKVNTYSLSDNNIEKARISISKGDKGNCSIVIKDNLTKGGKGVNVASGALMGDNCISNPFKSTSLFSEMNTISNELDFKFINPTSDFLYIYPGSEETYKIEVYQLSGRKILEFTGQGENSFPLTGINPNMYLLRFTSKDISTKKKLIVK